MREANGFSPQCRTQENMFQARTIAHSLSPEVINESPAILSHGVTPSAGFRVVLGGAASAGPIDLTEQLRVRLRFIAAVIAATIGIALFLRLVFNSRAFADGSPVRAQQIVSALSHLFLTLAMLWALFQLRRRSNFTNRSARRLEALVFGTTVVFATLNQVGVLILERDYIALHPFTHSMAAALPLALIVIGYGVLIPNTWRRCGVVLGLLVTISLIGHGVGFVIAPQTAKVIGLFCIQKVIWIGAAIAIVVYGAYRIEMLRDQVEIGRELGQYRLGRRLGEGGMGEVFLAEHLLLRRPCAIKLIRPELACDPKHLSRFEREVQATATLTHPNTVQVFDYGRANDGTFYYVMEFLPGFTLDQLVKVYGPMSPSRAVHFLIQVCAALSEAHSIGLIHRDIKPGNVIVCERGGLPDCAKLLDFGLVLPLANNGDEHLTQEGVVAGTPAYMSPEQAGGQEDIDAKSDIYSLGALAYFLMSGQPPFGNRTAVKMLAAHLYEIPRPLREICPDVPLELNAVVHQCLAKNRKDRFASVQCLKYALETCHAIATWTTEDGLLWWQGREQFTSSGGIEKSQTARSIVVDKSL
jgi:eukaryotic-like serine/threonine-protein kinase